MGFFDKLFGTSKEVQKIDKDNQRIDELKKTVPIWKKEFYRDGSIWVNAHP